MTGVCDSCQRGERLLRRVIVNGERFQVCDDCGITVPPLSDPTNIPL